MKIYREQAKQAHPIPSRAYAPRGPFPVDLFREPEIIDNYEPAMNEDGSGFPEGSTAQNNFQPIKWLYCGVCYERVKASETEGHVCEVTDGTE